jgi:coproporphyrinogen III oxidase
MIDGNATVGNLEKDFVPTRIEIESWLQELQAGICTGLEKLDGSEARFATDKWNRPGGGGGISRAIAGEGLIEKGGVNFSAVEGEVSDKMAKGLKLEGKSFFATGVSIVLHPVSPMVPIIHMNVRYFELDNGTWWFGGGIDLTPHYVVEVDAAYFHQAMERTCEANYPGSYARFKPWADRYFYLPHRKETRGIGGIFFDRAGKEEGISKGELWKLVRGIGNSFLPTYSYLASKNRELPYTERELKFQRLRRGRYVEFNLVHDAGTKFGLETDGRTESILMSLPPLASWEYDYQPEEGSAEAFTLNYLARTF